MLPGFGLFRRLMTPVLIALAFWAGFKFARIDLQDRCMQAGGVLRADSLCRGLP
jgi:hypothetical protein